MKTGLYFGSFNPVHIGHLALANYFIAFTDLDQIWFVVSPHNPHKPKKSLLADYHRYTMVELALRDDPRFMVSNVEFSLPQPNYTIQTLTHLHEKYPKRQFSLILGADNLKSFHLWKNYEAILKYYHLYVYPRPGVNPGSLASHPSVTLVDAPQIEISASFIRNAIASGKDIRFFMPESSYVYLQEMHFYKP